MCNQRIVTLFTLDSMSRQKWRFCLRMVSRDSASFLPWIFLYGRTDYALCLIKADIQNDAEMVMEKMLLSYSRSL